MKGMTSSFSPEALARYEYLVTSKVLAGLLPAFVPADYEGVYTHLSAENVLQKTSGSSSTSSTTKSSASKKRPWFRYPRDVCLKWNREGCEESECGRKHVCASCRGEHKISVCKALDQKQN